MSLTTYVDRVRVLSLAVLVAASGLSACGQGSGGAETGSGVPASSVTGAAEPAPAAAPSSTTPTGPPPVVPLRDHCRGGQGAEASTVMVRGEGARDWLAVSTLGAGSTTALLVPQLDGDACGWLPYAEVLSRRGVRVVLLDHCNTGQSTCDNMANPFAGDRFAQLLLVARQAREAGTKRFVLVGASYGGTLVTAAAAPLGADAVVNLSGTGEADTLDLARSMPTVAVPVLAAAGRSEPDVLARIRSMLSTSPSRTKRFLEAPRGHGWDLVLDDAGRLTPAGTAVTDWVLGHYG